MRKFLDALESFALFAILAMFVGFIAYAFYKIEYEPSKRVVTRTNGSYNSNAKKESR